MSSSSSSALSTTTTTTRGCPPCASSRARGPRRTPAARAAGGGEHPGCLLCSSVVASTPGAMLGEVQEAVAKGAQAVELRLDFLFAGADGAVSQSMLDALVADAVPPLAAACRAAGAVSVATLRPRWEGGEYPSDSPSGSDDGERLRVGALRALAERTEVDFIDCEMLAAGSELVIKGKSFGTMPMEAHLDAGAARAGLKMMKFTDLAFLATLPFRKG